MNLTPEHQALWDAAEKAKQNPGMAAWDFQDLCPPATIQALITELTEARARVAEGYEIVLRQRAELTTAQAQVKVLVDRIRAHSKAYNDRLTEDGDFLGMDLPLASSFTLLDMAINEDLPTSTQSFLSELERLRGNQRTPGTVEVCARFKYWDTEADESCSDKPASCHFQDCPIRPVKEPQA